jgi:hypothetical protein
MIRPILSLRLAIGLVLFLTATVFAQQKQEANEKKGPLAVMKQVTGQVSAIDKRCIAVVYKRDAAGEYEIPLTIKEPPKLEHVKELNQIKMGDTVTVQYEQMTEISKDGKEIIGEKFAKTIIFLKPAPPAPPEKEEAENPLASDNAAE